MRTYPDILEWSVRKFSLSPPALARARGPGGGGETSTTDHSRISGVVGKKEGGDP